MNGIWDQLTEHPIRTALLITLPILAAFFPPLVGWIAWATAPAWLPPAIAAASVLVTSIAGILLHNNVFGRFLEKTFKQLEAPFKINYKWAIGLSLLVLTCGATAFFLGTFLLPALLPAALIAKVFTSTFLPLASAFVAMLVATLTIGFSARCLGIKPGEAASKIVPADDLLEHSARHTHANSAAHKTGGSKPHVGTSPYNNKQIGSTNAGAGQTKTGQDLQSSSPQEGDARVAYPGPFHSSSSRVPNNAQGLANNANDNNASNNVAKDSGATVALVQARN